MWDVIKLGRIIYGAEESRQIVKESIVATAYEKLHRIAVRRIGSHYLIGFDHLRKAASGKINKANLRLIGLVNCNPDFRRIYFVKVFVFNRLKILHQRIEGMLAV